MMQILGKFIYTQLIMDSKPMENFNPFEPEGAIIQVRDFEKGRAFKGKSAEGMLVAVLRGRLSIKAEGVSKPVPAAHFVFIPPGIYYVTSFPEDASLAFFSLERHIGFSEEFLFSRLNGLAEKYHAKGHAFTFMGIDRRLRLFMDSITAYSGMERIPSRLLDIKLEELFYLMDCLYAKEELAAFFHPVLSSNAGFTYFVLRSHEGAKTVVELAGKSNMSLSAFEKEFKRVFLVSPYRWMKQKKAGRLLESIRHSGKPFKEISDEFGFTSTAKMNDFCTREWGLPPGKLRNRKALHINVVTEKGSNM